MALRRELLPILLAAATLLIGPGKALAAPQWLPSEPLPSSFASVADPAVATDADGNSIAVWIDRDAAPDEVLAVYRPRGGGWEMATTGLEQELTVAVGSAPRAVALPDGSFVVVWVANRSVRDPVLRSATRSPSGAWTTEDVRDLTCCTSIVGLEAGTDGSVMVVSRDDGSSVSNTKASASAPWDAPQTVGIGTVADFAVGPDGGAVAVSTGSCGESPCIRASHRPPSGVWGGQETVGITEGVSVAGLAVTANPNAYATAVWAVRSVDGEVVGPPGDVLGSDRTPGPGGTWSSEPDSVAHLEADTPNCGLRCIDIAAGAGGAQLAAWQQSGASGEQIAAGVRSAGGDWVGPETVSGTVRVNDAPYVAITTSGVPVVAWSSNANNESADANGSHRDAAGVWHPVLLGRSQDDSVSLGDLDPDGDGNALTAFQHRGGVFTSGFDGGGPRFTGFSVPAAGAAGETLGFSGTAEDNWSGVAGISWRFGDGGTAFGGAVTHAYGAGGEFNAAATATDGVGNVSRRTGTTAVTAGPTPSPTPPPPDPCGSTDRDKDGVGDGCDDNNGAARPVPFKTVNATVVSGDVFVKLPAGAARASQAKAPKGFVRLEGAETIPVRSILDTSKGRVRLRTASDTRNHVQTADFFRGRFVVRQVRKPRGKARKRSNKVITDIVLNGSSFRRACRTTTASISQKRRRSRKRVRRLFGDGKGSFRTRGRNAAATVRGTRWGVQDRCDGTLVTVQRGRVSVRDLVKRRTVIVRTGKKYLARRR
jgi:hypothetical protein